MMKKSPAFLPTSAVQSTIGDRFWLWGRDAGAHNLSWGLPRSSRITSVEAASYLGLSNLIVVRHRGRPQLPADQSTWPFLAFKRVVWSVAGAGGEADQKECGHVLELAARYPNITGIMIDDFFSSKRPTGDEERAASPQSKLRELRGKASSGRRPLDLWTVLYEHELENSLVKYLKLLDIVTFWTWDSEKLQALERNLERLEQVAGQCGRMLGCYLWDYGKKKPMPLDFMEHQCELGLQWLRQGRIEGMVFLASCICDLELEAVEWARNWIAKVADERT
jgi:hypothetical protein